MVLPLHCGKLKVQRNIPRKIVTYYFKNTQKLKVADCEAARINGIIYCL